MIDQGPWRVELLRSRNSPATPSDVYLMSDDFTFDAGLIVTGNFGSLDDKLTYAAALCEALNRLPGTRPLNWREG